MAEEEAKTLRQRTTNNICRHPTQSHTSYSLIEQDDARKVEINNDLINVLMFIKHMIYIYILTKDERTMKGKGKVRDSTGKKTD